MKFSRWAASLTLALSGLFGGPLAPPATPAPAASAAMDLDMEKSLSLQTGEATKAASPLRDAPEPATLIAAGLGLLALGLAKRQRSQSR